LLHQGTASGDRGAEMTGAARQITMMQVVGFDAVTNQRPHQCFQRGGIIVDAFQQHCLAQHG